MRVRTFLPAVAAFVACSALLTACGGDSDNDSGAASDPTPTRSATASADAASPSAAAEAAEGSEGAAAGTPQAVNKSFEDDVMGHKATVLKYVPDYEPSAAAKSKFSALENQKVVLVNVKVTASAKYYTSFGATSFRLTGMSNGIDQASTTILDDEVKAAGYEPLEDAKTGKSSTGWIVFTPAKDTQKLVLRYKRLAAKTSDGKAITAKTFDTPLN
ncbi:hypothetical protein ACFYWS_03180 [Streptomyces sp. NPDC002795]|uniref:hypothetical protein n=1 Tax=Streptomyces sp. NPDC002795 TaxID=3364665 RepID=UPI00369F33B3